MYKHNWIELSQDADTGIESTRAHFQGHTYDPHGHDTFLVGVTEQGVQQTMAWARVLWLSWLAWQIFRSAPRGPGWVESVKRINVENNMTGNGGIRKRG